MQRACKDELWKTELNSRPIGIKSLCQEVLQLVETENSVSDNDAMMFVMDLFYTGTKTLSSSLSTLLKLLQSNPYIPEVYSMSLKLMM